MITRTTWPDSAGVRHLALKGPAGPADDYLCDVFTPCEGYIPGALALYTDPEEAVTCIWCMTSSFEKETDAMNLEAIESLGEDSLLEHFFDHDAMAANLTER